MNFRKYWSLCINHTNNIANERNINPFPFRAQFALFDSFEVTIESVVLMYLFLTLIVFNYCCI
jgi:hypothetical protein